jgi:putative hemolysin
MLIVILLGFFSVILSAFSSAILLRIKNNPDFFPKNKKNIFLITIDEALCGINDGTSFLHSLFFSLYFVKALFLLTSLNFFIQAFNRSFFSPYPLAFVLFLFLFLLFFYLLTDLVPLFIADKNPRRVTQLTLPFASIVFFITIPFSFISYKLLTLIMPSLLLQYSIKSVGRTKKEISKFIKTTQFSPTLLPHEKDLLVSVLDFQERTAKEIMIPRGDLFMLPSDTSIVEAARKTCDEGYSRIPIFKKTSDNITGIVMYKDILEKYVAFEASGGKEYLLDAPLESLQKSPFYIPETKKLSILLQDFLRKKVHIAVIVDEYGNTEGIITIEDILEQIVGEIADEFDDEEKLCIPCPDGSWIVDAKMSILDIEDELGIHIPADSDYDTLAGFLFDRAGTIPEKGFIVHQRDFEIEVLIRDERTVKKVQIKKINNEESKSS